MANLFTNTDKVAAEALRLLINNLQFCKIVNQKYSKTFKAPESVGDTIRLRVPFNPRQRSGKVAVPQDFVETFRTLSISEQEGSDVKFSSLEKELDIKEFSDRVLDKEIPNLATHIESLVLADLMPQVSNAIVNSTLTSRDIYKAKARLDENLAPMDEKRIFMINPSQQVDLLEGTEKFFNSAEQIDKQYIKGKMGKFSGFGFVESNLIPNYETGTNSVRTVAVAANVADGDSTIDLSGLDATGTIKRGEIFTINTGGNDVKDLNYQTKKEYSRPKQFVVLADATAVAGAVTISVAPIYDGSTVAPSSTATLKNVSRLPASGDAVVFLGSENESYSQSLAFHPDFATLAFCDAKAPRGVNEASSKMYEGIGMRYVEDFDITNDDYIHRFDTYFGQTILWDQLATRVINIP